LAAESRRAAEGEALAAHIREGVDDGSAMPQWVVQCLQAVPVVGAGPPARCMPSRQHDWAIAAMVGVTR